MLDISSKEHKQYYGEMKEQDRNSILQTVYEMVGERLSETEITEEELREWVEDKVEVVSYKGRDICFINWEYMNQEEPDEILTALMSCNQVSDVVLEYFEPELQKNMQNLRNPFKQLFQKAYESKIDDLGKADGKKLHFARQLSQVCANEKKRVNVMDIGNKPEYTLNKILSRMAPGVIGNFIDTELMRRGIADYPYITTGGLINMLGFLYAEKAEKGWFNKQETSEIENWLFDLEDARRLVVAEGIKQRIDELDLPQSSDDPNKMLVIYPPAHNLRIKNYLLENENNHMSKNVKDVVYKVMGVNLDFENRIYEYRTGLQNLHESGYRWREKPYGDNLANKEYQKGTVQLDSPRPDSINWILTSRRKIE